MKPSKALKIVARQNNCTCNEVYREIEKAIEEGMKSTDPEAVSFWKSFDGTPTPEEVISEIYKKIK